MRVDLLRRASAVAQVYSGNFLDGSLRGTKQGATYEKHGALCLETQGFPNAINQAPSHSSNRKKTATLPEQPIAGMCCVGAAYARGLGCEIIARC